MVDGRYFDRAALDRLLPLLGYRDIIRLIRRCLILHRTPFFIAMMFIRAMPTTGSGMSNVFLRACATAEAKAQMLEQFTHYPPDLLKQYFPELIAD